jgi:uncharacterized RDD family membrane protein YckC
MKDRFYYQTSEKIRIDYRIAGMAVRVAAFLVDALVLGAVFCLFYILVILLLAGSAVLSKAVKSDAPYVVLAVIASVYALLFLLYPFIFEWLMKGQTPGKKALRIRAVREDGSYLTFTAVLLRNLFRIVDMLPVSYLVGGVTALANRRRKRVGDFVAGTVVVSESATKLAAVERYKGEDPFAGIADPRLKFQEKDLELLEAYFASRRDVDRQALERIEAGLCGIIGERTGIPKPANLKPADFIMALYQKL